MLQPASLDIWDKKYRLKRKDGEPVDRAIDDTYRRVARALADVEDGAERRELWFERFSVRPSSWRNSCRPHRVQRRRPGTQTRDVDHQLHRFRNRA